MSTNTAVAGRLDLIEREQLETLLNLSQAFNSTMELDALLPRILSVTLKVTEAEAGSVWLARDDRLTCAATAGAAAASLAGTYRSPDEGAIGDVLRDGATLIVPNALQDGRFAAYRTGLSGFNVRSALVIPLRANGKPVGALELVNDVGGKDHFSDSDVAFLEALADDAAAAVRNAELYGAERRAHHFEKELNLFGQLFVIVIVMLAVGLAFTPLLSSGPSASPIVQVGSSWAAILVFMVPILAFARRNRIPLSEFGMRKEGWKRHALEGLLLSVPVILMLLVAKLIWYPDSGPVISFSRYQSYPMPLMAFDLLFYLPHTFLQELTARGLVQGSLQRFMSDSHPVVPVLVASSLFGVGHMYAGLTFAFLMLVGSFILGMLFLRQRSLVGVTITHFVGGLAALAFGLF